MEDYRNFCRRNGCDGSMERFRIWETCNKCGASKQVECCEACAGFDDYEYPDEETEEEK